MIQRALHPDIFEQPVKMLFQKTIRTAAEAGSYCRVTVIAIAR